MKRTFSNYAKAQAALRANGHCEGCTRKLWAGDYNYDHIIPHAMGGESTSENCQLLCKACHSVKTTREDVPAIAKAKRRERKRQGIRKTQSRPMLGTRASGIRKRLDGTVENW